MSDMQQNIWYQLTKDYTWSFLLQIQGTQQFGGYFLKYD